MTVDPSYHLRNKILFAVGVLFLGQEGKGTIITPNNASVVQLHPNTEVNFTVVNISNIHSYVTFQVHSQQGNISLSSSKLFPKDITLTGTHLGYVSLLNPNDVKATMYVRSDVNDTVNILIYAQLYTPADPVPGACNQVFKLEIDPNIHTVVSKYSTEFEFQWANIGFQRQGKQEVCEDRMFQNRLSYDVYIKYFPETDNTEETFFSYLFGMFTVDDIKMNGEKIATFNNTGSVKSLGTINTAQGQGIVYAIVVTDVLDGTSAAYIPVQSYSCIDGNQLCDRKVDAIDIVVAVLCGIVGAFLCFLGHRYIKTEFFFFGLLGFMLISYILLTRFTTMSTEVSLAVSLVPGMIGGLMFLGLWYFFGIPVISVLLVGMTGGYLVSSILFLTPFGNLSYWRAELTYGMTFTCGVLVVPVFLLCFSRPLNILSCTFVGSYMCAITADIFLWTSLKYIILNSIYHQTVPDYLSVTVTVPIKTLDLVLFIVWGILFIAGFTFQVIREHRKPPFPACPAHVKKSRNLQRPFSRISNEDEERKPLLDERSRSRYQGHQNIFDDPGRVSVLSRDQNQPA